MKNDYSSNNFLVQKLYKQFVSREVLTTSCAMTFTVLLLSLCFIPCFTSAEHFQAISSLDSDENIGESIDKLPRSNLSQVDVPSSGETSNSTLEKKELDGNSQERENVTNVSIPTNSSITDEEQEELEWRDGNQTRRSHTRVAAVAVYGSVILIALFGILIKYFVTQYETLQANAQMEYQQLRNVNVASPCH